MGVLRARAARGGRGRSTYKVPEHERVELLRAFGVRRFGALPYPHKPDMADWLNSWSAEFAARTPDALHSATFFPEPGYPGVHLDTTMAFSDFMNDIAPFPAELLPRLAAAGDRVVLGTDFPSIPYPYVHQLQALAEVGLGDDWLRAVCWTNPARLLAWP